jgi:hypothetical protein
MLKNGFYVRSDFASHMTAFINPVNIVAVTVATPIRLKNRKMLFH